MSLQDNRKWKIRELLNIIKTTLDLREEILEEKLIAETCIKWGCARRTVQEYLKNLEGSNAIIRQNNRIWTQKHLEAEELLKKIENQTEIVAVKPIQAPEQPKQAISE